jgi:hypothetical protein
VEIATTQHSNFTNKKEIQKTGGTKISVRKYFMHGKKNQYQRKNEASTNMIVLKATVAVKVFLDGVE